MHATAWVVERGRVGVQLLLLLICSVSGKIGGGSLELGAEWARGCGCSGWSQGGGNICISEHCAINALVERILANMIGFLLRVYTRVSGVLSVDDRITTTTGLNHLGRTVMSLSNKCESHQWQRMGYNYKGE
ncbi:hypothetical protein OCU04_004529 [Sclerotinia nivalis]|uniref:Secreted protein n=1 Tax=Sclerotinia nivalis TaxID=352851 RepID=A0A9X0AQL6_9HELO|nr:hypothetical protein OCU04_004529 [Sclerotinia nivalis]